MSEKPKRRGRLLVAFVQTHEFSIRYEIENAKATDKQRALFARMQQAVVDVMKAERRTPESHD